LAPINVSFNPLCVARVLRVPAGPTIKGSTLPKALNNAFICQGTFSIHLYHFFDLGLFDLDFDLTLTRLPDGGDLDLDLPLDLSRLPGGFLTGDIDLDFLLPHSDFSVSVVSQ